MDGQQSLLNPSTYFGVACVAFSVVALTNVWWNRGATASGQTKEARPKPRRRIAVDSLYAGGSSNGAAEPESALSILAELISWTARLSGKLRQRSGGYVATPLLTELSLITASLCQLQAAVCNNTAAVSPGSGLGACFVASTSSLNATLRMIENEQSSSSTHQGANLLNDALQQLRAQKPALDFLLQGLKADYLPPTPPGELEIGLLKPSDAGNLGPASSSMNQHPTGFTPAVDSRGWIEPPPEYSPPSDPDAFPLAEKVTGKVSATEQSSEPEPEDGQGDVNAEALYQAVTDDDLQVASDLLDAGLDANEPFGELQRTALHQAAHLNHCACLTLLLRHGATMSTEDSKGDTPLHLAAWIGNVEALQTLLAHGADVDWLSGRDGYSPLWCAISAYHIDAARLLLKHGARVSLRSGTGLSPLHQAAVTGQSAMCELLLERGAQADTVDDDLNTPLHYAAVSGSAASVQILLRSGAIVEAQQAQGLTPAHWAAHKGHVDVLAMLLEYGAPLNAVATEGATPLHLGANRGHLAIVRLLLEKGAKKNLKDAVWDGVDGTAAEMAKAKKHGRVAKTIVNWHGGR